MTPSLRLAVGAALALVACDAPSQPVPAPSGTSTVSGNPPVASASASSTPEGPPRRIAVEGKAMGTHVSIAAFTGPGLDEPTLKPKLEKAFAEIRRLEGLMTTWRPDSEISRVNAAAGKEPVAVSRETFEVVEKSLWISNKSGGLFDITFEAMHGIWKFDEDREAKLPDPAAVAAARKLIDWHKVKLDAGKTTVMLEKPGMRMSLGGIAKGYAVDVAARALDREGLGAYFVQAGGDLYVRGKKPDGAPWRVGVRDPRKAGCAPGGEMKDCYFAMLEVEDHAFSTSGDYERSFVKDGKRYHHIIDPRSGYPATASRSVTIWAKDAFTADAVDNAVFILGPKKGLELVESLDDCGAVIVDANNEVAISKRLEGKVVLLRNPTDGI